MFFGGVNDETAIIDRPGQLEALDFVGCIRSISINGNEKNLFTQSLNSSGLKDTCNYVESGSCAREDECGISGKGLTNIRLSHMVFLNLLFSVGIFKIKNDLLKKSYSHVQNKSIYRLQQF